MHLIRKTDLQPQRVQTNGIVGSPGAWLNWCNLDSYEAGVLVVQGVRRRGGGVSLFGLRLWVWGLLFGVLGRERGLEPRHRMRAGGPRKGADERRTKGHFKSRRFFWCRNCGKIVFQTKTISAPSNDLADTPLNQMRSVQTLHVQVAGQARVLGPFLGAREGGGGGAREVRLLCAMEQSAVAQPSPKGTRSRNVLWFFVPMT